MQPRVPPGTGRGGEWTAAERADSDVSLSPDDTTAKALLGLTRMRPDEYTAARVLLGRDEVVSHLAGMLPSAESNQGRRGVVIRRGRAYEAVLFRQGDSVHAYSDGDRALPSAPAEFGTSAYPVVDKVNNNLTDPELDGVAVFQSAVGGDHDETLLVDLFDYHLDDHLYSGR